MSKHYLKQRRIFSIAVKKQLVGAIEAGAMSVSQAAREYAVSRGAIYAWIHTYSRYNQKGAVLVVDKQSQDTQNRRLRARIAELEQAVGHKQMQLDYFQKMVEMLEQEYGVNLKKKYGPALPPTSADKPGGAGS